MSQEILIHSLIPVEQLIRGQAYLDGRWIDGGERYTVRNPHTWSGLASVCRLDDRVLDGQLEALSDAWGGLSPSRRHGYIATWVERIRGCQNALALLLSQESGKSWQQARSEVRDALSEAERLLHGLCRPLDSQIDSQRSRQPQIQKIESCPSRPFQTAIAEAIPVLLAGRSVLLRPPCDMPLCGLALAVIADRIEIPPGAFNVAA